MVPISSYMLKTSIIQDRQMRLTGICISNSLDDLLYNRSRHAGRRNSAGGFYTIGSLIHSTGETVLRILATG